METIRERFANDEFDIIEIGFHPVLKKCCEVFDSYHYICSMYRGEDEITWVLHQRRKLDPERFLARLRQITDTFRPDLNFAAGLAYQDFTSRTFVEFTTVFEPYFPGLAPQDFYRYKTVQQLIDQFGAASRVESTAATAARKQEVVIAGMSCKFPAAAENPAQFWRMLLSGKDQVRTDPLRGDFEAGFLDGEVSKLDHKYFNISEAEAKTMDPQQILALELTELLWKDAGIDPGTLNKKRVGVYIGVWNEEFRGDQTSVYYPTGTNPSIVASRISYHYDLRGPSWVSNTACSSSLLAVHYACKDIEAGRIDYAIAGGVNMILGNTFTHNMRRSGFLLKDQRCKTFDDSANGYVRAEGGGLVLLVNKDFAEHYYAAVPGSAINQNGGRAQVITAPHPEAQEEVILDACQEAAIEARDITYVECHGTGTKIGDPIEISAIQNTVGQNRENTCYLGSVKSNIGHLESAAGIADLIKSVLILNHGKIPANLHFAKPNEFIDFESYQLKVVAEVTAIDPMALIGVSSFGFGGANAHVVISGVEEQVRKAIEDLPIPFDKSRTPALSAYYRLDQDQQNQPVPGSGAPPAADAAGGVPMLRPALRRLQLPAGPLRPLNQCSQLQPGHLSGHTGSSGGRSKSAIRRADHPLDTQGGDKVKQPAGSTPEKASLRTLMLASIADVGFDNGEKLLIIQILVSRVPAHGEIRAVDLQVYAVATNYLVLPAQNLPEFLEVVLVIGVIVVCQKQGDCTGRGCGEKQGRFSFRVVCFSFCECAAQHVELSPQRRLAHVI